MNSVRYEKPEAEIIEFSLEDIITKSTPTVTTTTPTTLPGTTGGVSVTSGSGEIEIPFSDLFQD